MKGGVGETLENMDILEEWQSIGQGRSEGRRLVWEVKDPVVYGELETLE